MDQNGQVKPSTRFLKQYSIPSDNHAFVGRIYDLSIISLSFDTYEELAKHPDCKYVIDVNHVLTALTERVESLNFVGGMLWPSPLPQSKSLPISVYDWLRVCADVFLMRYISVVDCTLLLANAVYELQVPDHRCTLWSLKDVGLPANATSLLGKLLDEQGDLRAERNSRIHHGRERSFTQDDTTFRMAAIFDHWGNGMRGTGRDGRPVNTSRSFREGLVVLQREFNQSTRQLVRSLGDVYNVLDDEFHSRFTPRFRRRTHPFGIGERIDE